MREPENTKNSTTEHAALLKKIEKLKQTLQTIKQEDGYGSFVPDAKTFPLLLGALSACRKVPGIADALNVLRLPACNTEEEKAATRAHLESIYGITDATSLAAVCGRLYQAQYQFDQFQSFWDGTPMFDEKGLNEVGRTAFQTCKAFAELLRPYVGRHGFLAWDVNEQIGLMRCAVACGMIEEETFYTFAEPLARQAALYYTSWEGYAMSCLCGALYHMYSRYEFAGNELEQFCEININCLNHLFYENGAWTAYSWYNFGSKQFKIPPYEQRFLLRDWQGPAGCIATDAITVEGRPVGYMVREEPAPNMPDSGWRFFAGDETEDYLNTPENNDVYSLNTLCNYSPDILPLLSAPIGTAYSKRNGVWQEESRAPQS